MGIDRWIPGKAAASVGAALVTFDQSTMRVWVLSARTFYCRLYVQRKFSGEIGTRMNVGRQGQTVLRGEIRAERVGLFVGTCLRRSVTKGPYLGTCVYAKVFTPSDILHCVLHANCT